MSLTKKLREKGNIDFSIPAPLNLAHDHSGHDDSNNSHSSPATITETSVSDSTHQSPKGLFITGMTPAGMARHANNQRSEVFKENDSLKQQLSQWEGATAARLIDSDLISPSEWANRHENNFKTHEFKEFLEEIENAGGNIQPIKVRPIEGSNPTRYDIVFGHRRHRACLELRIPVLALIEKVDDNTLFIEMDRENRQRKDLRPFEQGSMYRRALDKGMYTSLRELCKATGASIGNASLAHRLARVDDKIIEAFKNPLEIRTRWIQPLLDAIEKNKDAVLNKSIEILTDREEGRETKGSSADVFQKLIASVDDVFDLKETNLPSIKANGQIIATVKQSNGRYKIEFKKGTVNESKIDLLISVIADAMKD